jgi:hypothetical protein
MDTEAEIDQAARMLPPSPSLVKTRNRTVTNPDVPQLRRIGLFHLPCVEVNDDISDSLTEKPITEALFTFEDQLLNSCHLPQLKDELPIDLSFLSRSNDSIDAPELSINHSEVSIDVQLESKDSQVHIEPIRDLVASFDGDTSVSSCESRGVCEWLTIKPVDLYYRQISLLMMLRPTTQLRFLHQPHRPPVEAQRTSQIGPESPSRTCSGGYLNSVAQSMTILHLLRRRIRNQTLHRCLQMPVQKRRLSKLLSGECWRQQSTIRRPGLRHCFQTRGRVWTSTLGVASDVGLVYK